MISFPKFFCIFMIFLICTLFWLLQSLPTINQFYIENGGESVLQKSVLVEESQLPSIVICNRLPYSHAALAAFGKSMWQDTLRAYLREWFDPSAIDLPDNEDMSEEDRRFAETAVSQVLPNTGLKQRLEQILLKCQDFLSSCVIHGVSMSGFNCCENVQPFLATFGGICWIFSNSTFLQEYGDSRFAIQLTFQIAKNSFISSFQTTHPGISVHLVAGNEGRIAIASELPYTHPYNLKDKQHKTLFIRKQVELDRRRRECERYNWRDLVVSSNNSSTSTLTTCLIEAAIQECSCVPLTVVLWTLQGDLAPSFLRRFDVSSICTADEYSKCARKYIIQSNPYQSTTVKLITMQKQMSDIVESCRHNIRSACQMTRFEATRTIEDDLPQEYKNTQDFVTRFSIAYDTIEVTEIVHERAITAQHLLTILGYNLATWFAIGHLIWSIISWFCTASNRSSYLRKVEPRPTMIMPSPIHIRSRNQHTGVTTMAPTTALAPLEITHSDHKARTLPAQTDSFRDGD